MFWQINRPRIDANLKIMSPLWIKAVINHLEPSETRVIIRSVLVKNQKQPKGIKSYEFV